jgi:hypothetical protein
MTASITIIADLQPDAKDKYTFTVYGAYKADSPLVESCLLGPVRLLRQPRMKQQAFNGFPVKLLYPPGGEREIAKDRSLLNLIGSGD